MSLALIAALAGCGSPESVAEPETSLLLPRPFTADEIRGGWVEGLTLVMRSTTPAGETLQRWTVVNADNEGAEIEYVTLDPDGNAAGDPQSARSGWVELRDHASFPADSGTREEVSHETPLGTLDGWLYTVEDPEQGTVTEYFFARSLPGAPVQVRTMRGDELVAEMEQIQRTSP